MGGLHIGNRQGYDFDSCSQFEREAERLGTGVQSRDTIALTVRFPRCLPRARYGHELRKPPGGEGRSAHGRQGAGRRDNCVPGYIVGRFIREIDELAARVHRHGESFLPGGGEGRSGDGRQRTGWPHKKLLPAPGGPGYSRPGNPTLLATPADSR